LLGGAKEGIADHLCKILYEHSQQPLLGAFSGDPSERHTGVGAVHLDDMAAMLAATPSSDDMEAILRFVDEGAKAAVFEHTWAKLERAGTRHIDLDALKLCVRLLPPFSSDERVSTGHHRTT
jgi:hypothetical protein